MTSGDKAAPKQPYTVEINTIEGGRLEWIGIFRASGANAMTATIDFGEKLVHGFHGKGAPSLRILDGDGNDIGGWL